MYIHNDITDVPSTGGETHARSTGPVSFFKHFDFKRNNYIDRIGERTIYIVLSLTMLCTKVYLNRAKPPPEHITSTRLQGSMDFTPMRMPWNYHVHANAGAYPHARTHQRTQALKHARDE